MSSGKRSVARVVHDGWANLLSGFGTSHDAGRYNTVTSSIGINQSLADRLYRADGIGRRIIDIPAEDMTREWVEVKGDDGAERIKQLADIKAKPKVNQALRWSGLYGGAVIVMGIDDGGVLDQPVNENRVRGLTFLRVYDRWRVNWSSTDLYSDSKSEKYGEPEFVTINPLTGGSFRVHESRILWFDGEDVPDQIRVNNNGWGDSRLQPVFDGLGRYAEAMGGASNIIRDFVTPVLGMKNLSDMIAGGQEAVVKSRLDILGLSQSMLNIRLIDADLETYTKQSSTCTGIDDLFEEFKHYLCALCGIPQTKLFGRSPGGENATGESDIRNWYDTISAEQETKMLPAVQRLVYLLDLAAGGEPENREVVCKPLWQPSSVEKAETLSKVAPALVSLVDYAIISGEAAQDILRGLGFEPGDIDPDINTPSMNE